MTQPTSPSTPATAADLGRLAREALRRRDYPEALRHLAALEGLAPSAANRLDIAFCHFHLGHLRIARDWYRRALELEPGNATAVNNLARVSAQLAELEIRDEKALSAETWNSLGQAQYNAGNFGLARKLFELATEADPDYITAYHNLGSLIRDQDIEPWIARLEQRPPNRAAHSPALQFLLARLYDRKGEYARAMALYKHANHLKYAEAPRAYDEARHGRLVDAIIGWFTPQRCAGLRERLAGLPLSPQPVVFVVGMPRSGSTLITRILAADPTVQDLGEAGFLLDCLNALIQRDGQGFPQVLDRLDDRGWLQLQQCYLQRIAQPGRLLVDKYLEGFLFLGLIAALFPGARAVHAVRERDDIMISCYKRMFPDGAPWSYDIPQMKHYYEAYRRLMAHWQAALPPGTIHDLVYRDLVEHPEREIPRLAAHCGLGPDLAERQFHRQPGLVKTASAQQVRRPIYRDALGSFERYRPYISFD